MNIRLNKVLKKTSRNVDRALSDFFDPLAEKVGGATNLVVGLMLVIFALIALFYVFFTNIGFISIVIAFVSIFLIINISTSNKLRIRKPWWYRERM